MFKRMSVLVRRDGDDRGYFSERWMRHAAPVSGLPKVRGYIQNHVVEEIAAPGRRSPIKADGFVELLWDRPEDMAEAFRSPAARPMIEDEPSFLGHGSGYALARATPLKEAESGKLILAAVGGDGPAHAGLEASLEAAPGVLDLIRDDVVELIAKPGMSPPQPVDVFFHLWFDSIDAAGRAGSSLLAEMPDSDLRVGAYLVTTRRFV